ncbi:MAG TPA: hypothetical protein VKP04_02700, partial [Ktedonobacteraceae bacterium]|nr:hypothetical protein [Ktedonobacteraceae bacterium]
MKKSIITGLHTQQLNTVWRVLSLLLLIFALIVVGGIVVLPHNDAVHAVGARINISPRSAPYSPQNSIRVAGFNFAANEQVNVYWNYNGPGTGTLEVSVIADSTGAFATKFKKPLAPTAIYTIAAVGQTSGSVATGTFQLLPQLFLNPQAGGPGTKFDILGNAFGAGEAVQIYWNYTGPGTGFLLTTVTGNSTGSFKTTAVIPPANVHGIIPVVGVGQTSNATGSSNFLLYPLALALAPLNGSAQTTLTVSAYGFVGSEIVNIFWNNSFTPVLSATATAIGYINPITITVPAGTVPGNYTVKAVGKTSHRIAKNTFAVVPTGASLSLSTGPAGVNVQITGQGFAPRETVNILWNYNGPGTGTPMTSIVAGISGTISASFNIPADPIGTYTIAAIGTTSNSDIQSTFTLSNGLAVSPA